MLEDVDASLSAWVGEALPGEAEVTFLPPDEPADVASHGPATRHRRPLVNLFLHELEAEESALPAAPVRSRASDGTYAQPPARRYRLTYLVTPIAADPATEHRLLGAILELHARSEVLPESCLRGDLRLADAPLPLFLAPAGRSVPPLYFRSDLGARRRVSIALDLVVPVRPDPVLEPAPPVRRVDLESELSPPPGRH